jgi:glycosyltransferase involved in cell wall biosynthesis
MFKMQKKKVLLITYGHRDHASTRIRALNHFDRLKDIFDVTWVPRVLKENRKGLFSKMIFAFSKRLQQLRLGWFVIMGKFDLVFIQVMFLREWQLRVLKTRGTFICFDFDDAVYTYSQVKFDIMMQYADKIIVASPYLQQYVQAYQKDCRVIFSPVDTQLITPAKKVQPVFTIGWIGSPWTLPYLENLVPVFKQLATKISFKVLVVGAAVSIAGVDIECVPWSEQSEIEALGRMDVGIMPLSDDDWTKMKGGYKLFLYMAAGVPVVASPYGINGTIVENNFNGFLAASDEEWLDAFLKLSTDKELNCQLGVNARRDAEQRYSYQVCTGTLQSFLLN